MQNSAQAKTRDIIAEKAGVSHDTIAKTEKVLERCGRTMTPHHTKHKGNQPEAPLKSTTEGVLINHDALNAHLSK